VKKQNLKVFGQGVYERLLMEIILDDHKMRVDIIIKFAMDIALNLV